MIVTILPGSGNFHAVEYNERKVAKGAAKLLEMRNMGFVGLAGKPTAGEAVKHLRLYSSMNGRIKNTQFHASISCKGHEMTEEELLDFAHEYLKEMGYGDPKQPLLIYVHHDTDNLHLHVVTSRVAPDGRKIRDGHERARSRKAIDKILGVDRKGKLDKALEDAKGYSFSSFAQFKAVMEALGYEAYMKRETVFVKRDGAVQRKMPLSAVEALYKDTVPDKARQRQLRGILLKYRDVCVDRKELKKELKDKFGIDLVFFGRRDEPYGYMIVDHANKAVIHGARVLAAGELLDFATPEQRFDRIGEFLDRMLGLDPAATAKEVNAKLRRFGAYVDLKGRAVRYKDMSRPLGDGMAFTLERNGRVALARAFHPCTGAERDLLCGIFGVWESSLVKVEGRRPQSYADALARLRQAFREDAGGSPRGKMQEEGFSVRQEGGDVFAVDFRRHILVNLTAEGFDTGRLAARRGDRKPARKDFGNKIGGILNPSNAKGSSSANREWEVGGKKGGLDDVDDGRTLKR